MPSLEFIFAALVFLALLLYVLLAGEAIGSTMWYGTCFTKNRRAFQDHILASRSRMWEGHQIWVVLAGTLLLSAFPLAFERAVSILHLPLGLFVAVSMLRIVALGASTFKRGRFWSWLFALCSVALPFLLGVTLGSLASGGVRPAAGDYVTDFVGPWSAPFPMVVGCLTVAVFALLSAGSLWGSAPESWIEGFRYRVLISGLLVLGLGIAVFAMAQYAAPVLWAALQASWWGPVIVASATGTLLLMLICAWNAWMVLTRVMIIFGVSMAFVGWGMAQHPYLIVPDVTVFNAAAPKGSLRFLAAAMLIGPIVVSPVLYLLYRLLNGTLALSRSPSS